ncbi:endolytic transglycosylase MltG [Halomonas sp. HP20-15]|uniref:endolytic transglycosylase MltG n=1 Tax=Halomonas sp. HP20-15 TaxID=3085901 RepID=UPI0029816016|nr:endolytic transglycosylase MltG [Halomonas sp. HP20-15]MDW5378892.1 endolytic transglycosylase MltG [Halomonas sp. HP20-15]
MRLLKIILVLAVVLTVAGFAGFRYWQAQLDQALSIDAPLVYEVPRGASFNQVVHDLAERGIIAETWALRLLKRVDPQSLPPLRAGEFRLEPGMSARGTLALLGSDNIVTYSLTIPEGWTFAQMREELAAAAKLDHRAAALSDTEVMAELGHPDQHPEGRFFPDTYRYHKGVSDLEILAQAYQRMQHTLEAVWAQRDEGLPLETPYQALIMASLIERETGADGERRKIAGVFTRRLAKGMRLQTDPTVIYGLGDDYDGNITRADLRRETPYNTYLIEGLPPTPIAMPGRAALEAAVHPAEGGTLYFVAKGDGSHHFSKTLDEHNAAVRRYILNR